MKKNYLRPGNVLLVVLIAALFVTGCRTASTEGAPNANVNSSSEKLAAQQEPASQQQSGSNPQVQPTVDPTATEPEPAELNATLKRVFDQDAIAADIKHPAYLIGDFNGDGSNDIAIVVRSSSSSVENINSEFANWTLEDPKSIRLPGANPLQQTPGAPKPVLALKGETLLAIIHGVGGEGWRSKDARQVFLLKNTAETEMTVRSPSSFSESKDKNKLPPIQGDVIAIKSVRNEGLVFWTGAKYAWYSPVLG